MTAHYLTHSTYPIKANDTVLFTPLRRHGTIARADRQDARRARNRHGIDGEKSDLAQAAGADATINYTANDFAAQVKKYTNGKGVNVVYDSVGKNTYERSLDSLAPLGHLVIFGQASGPVPPFDTAILNAKGSLTLSRPSLTHNVANHADVSRRAGDLFKWIESGQFNVKIGKSIHWPKPQTRIVSWNRAFPSARFF